MKGFWKVPCRQVYCMTFFSMLKQAFWCHVVIKLFPRAYERGVDDELH